MWSGSVDGSRRDRLGMEIQLLRISLSDLLQNRRHISLLGSSVRIGRKVRAASGIFLFLRSNWVDDGLGSRFGKWW